MTPPPLDPRLDLAEEEGESSSADVAVFFLSDRVEFTVRRTVYANGGGRGLQTIGDGPNVLFSGTRRKGRKEASVLILFVLVRQGERPKLAMVISHDVLEEEIGAIRWLLDEWGVDRSSPVVHETAVLHTTLERSILDPRGVTVAGTSLVEEAEVYRLQGELVPVLWPEESFVPWVLDLTRG